VILKNRIARSRRRARSIEDGGLRRRRAPLARQRTNESFKLANKASVRKTESANI
jgi:hypothetical protein